MAPKKKPGLTIHDARMNEVRTQNARLELANKDQQAAMRSLNINKKTSQKGKKQVVKEKRSDHLDSTFREYAKCISDPFNHPPVRSPMVGNVVPTDRSFTATTTSNDSISVVAGSACEIGLFGGCGIRYDAASVDPESNHCQPQRIGGATAAQDYIIGPIPGTTVPREALGYRQTGLAVGGSSIDLTVATVGAIQNDTSLPFVALEASPHHTRWRLVAMGIRLYNTTEEGTRGGYARVVQPSVDYENTSQQDYARFGESFKTTTDVNDDNGMEVIWIPKSRSFGYNHVESTTGSGSTAAADVKIWFNNPTTSLQQLVYEVICHWEIAGAQLATLASESTQTVHAQAMQMAARTVRARSATGKSLGAVAQHYAMRAMGTVKEVLLPRVVEHFKSSGATLASKMLTAV